MQEIITAINHGIRLPGAVKHLLQMIKSFAISSRQHYTTQKHAPNLSILIVFIFILRAYSPIAFNKRVTFWLQNIQSLPCACVYAELFTHSLTYNHYALAHAHTPANADAQGSDRAR